MGKGGCEFIEAGANCIRGILCAFCCFVCIGPILFIVGIVMLTIPNDYASNVNKYNDAVSNFNKYYQPIVRQTSAKVANMYNILPSQSGTDSPLSPQFQGTLPSSSTADQVEGTPLSYPLKSQQNIPVGNGQLQVNMTFAPNDNYGNDSEWKANSILFNLPALYNKTKRDDSLRCSSSDIDHHRSCQRLCENNLGSNCAVYSGSGYCNYHSSCSGTCSVQSFQTLSCSVFTTDNRTGKLATSRTKSSCLYPFAYNSQPMGSCSAPVGGVPVVFLNNEDPFIQIQSILHGASFSFGLTAQQQHNVGVALLATGGCVTFLILVIGYCLYKAIYKDDQSAARVYSSFGRTYTGGRSGAAYNSVPQPTIYDASANNTTNGMYNNQQVPPPPPTQPPVGYSSAPPQGYGATNNNIYEQQPQQQQQNGYYSQNAV